MRSCKRIGPTDNFRRRWTHFHSTKCFGEVRKFVGSHLMHTWNPLNWWLNTLESLDDLGAPSCICSWSMSCHWHWCKQTSPSWPSWLSESPSGCLSFPAAWFPVSKWPSTLSIEIHTVHSRMTQCYRLRRPRSGTGNRSSSARHFLPSFPDSGSRETSFVARLR